jgi:protein-S-isoprenylcysteine O-methyltransferase Ste14
MYVSLLAILLGQALLFPSLSVAAFALFAWLATFTFVRLYEEPTLVRTYGEQYEDYRRNVPGWLPRLTPWKTDSRS